MAGLFCKKIKTTFLVGMASLLILSGCSSTEEYPQGLAYRDQMVRDEPNCFQKFWKDISRKPTISPVGPMPIYQGNLGLGR